VRFVEHLPHRFIAPPDIENPEAYTLVSISCFAGRSLDAKRNLYRGIVENLAALNIPKKCVKIFVHEVSKENVGSRGGQAFCDINLEYDINV
jgi:hypothetical protein